MSQHLNALNTLPMSSFRASWSTFVTSEGADKTPNRLSEHETPPTSKLSQTKFSNHTTNTISLTGSPTLWSRNGPRDQQDALKSLEEQLAGCFPSPSSPPTAISTPNSPLFIYSMQSPAKASLRRQSPTLGSLLERWDSPLRGSPHRTSSNSNHKQHYSQSPVLPHSKHNADSQNGQPLLDSAEIRKRLLEPQLSPSSNHAYSISPTSNSPSNSIRKALVDTSSKPQTSNDDEEAERYSESEMKSDRDDKTKVMGKAVLVPPQSTTFTDSRSTPSPHSSETPNRHTESTKGSTLDASKSSPATPSIPEQPLNKRSSIVVRKHSNSAPELLRKKKKLTFAADVLNSSAPARTDRSPTISSSTEQPSAPPPSELAVSAPIVRANIGANTKPDTLKETTVEENSPVEMFALSTLIEYIEEQVTDGVADIEAIYRRAVYGVALTPAEKLLLSELRKRMVVEGQKRVSSGPESASDNVTDNPLVTLMRGIDLSLCCRALVDVVHEFPEPLVSRQIMNADAKNTADDKEGKLITSLSQREFGMSKNAQRLWNEVIGHVRRLVVRRALSSHRAAQIFAKLFMGPINQAEESRAVNESTQVFVELHRFVNGHYGNPETQLHRLEQLVLKYPQPIISAAVKYTSFAEANTVAEALLEVFHAAERSIELVKLLITEEVSQEMLSMRRAGATSFSMSTLLRNDGVAAKALVIFGRMAGGERYVVRTLKDVAALVLREPAGALEVDPARRTLKSPRRSAAQTVTDEGLQYAQNRVVALAQLTFDRIATSVQDIPQDIRVVCFTLKSIISSLDSHVPWQPFVGGFFFLRLVCPMLVAPDEFGLVDRKESTPLSSEARRAFLLVGKAVMSLASGGELGPKELHMQFLRAFIEKNRKYLLRFYDELTLDPNSMTKADAGADSPPLGLRKKASPADLLVLLRLIETNIDDITKQCTECENASEIRTQRFLEKVLQQSSV